MNRSIDDLLRPTVEARHDVVDVEQPFAANGILYGTFFLGPLWGLVIALLNEHRCGLHRRGWGIALLVLVLAAWVGSATWHLGIVREKADRMAERARAASSRLDRFPRAEGRIDDEIPTPQERIRMSEESAARPLFRNIWRAIGLLVVWLWTIPQRRRTSIAEGRGVEAVSFWWTTLIVFIAVTVVENGGFAFARWVHG